MNPICYYNVDLFSDKNDYLASSGINTEGGIVLDSFQY